MLQFIEDLPEFVVVVSVCGCGFFMVAVLSGLWKYLPMLVRLSQSRTDADRQLATALAQLSTTLRDTLESNTVMCRDAQRDYKDEVTALRHLLKELKELSVLTLRHVEAISTALEVRVSTPRRKEGK